MAITQNGVLQRDDNDYPVMGGVSSTDGNTVLNAQIDPITGRLLVDNSGGGSGTVTDFIFTDANGFDGTVTTSTSTPTLSLTTTVTSGALVKSNSGALTAATAGTDYANLTFKTIAVSGQSDVVADSAADTLTFASGAGMTITTNAGTDTITFTANGGSATDITVGTTTVSSGTTTRILYDNAGVLGEYTITGTGTVVAMATAPTFVTSITTPAVLATANDSGALGASGTAFADLFLASGGVINWVAGDYTLTHSLGVLTANKDLRVTTVGTDATSVATLNGTQAFQNKTITNSNNVLGGVTMTLGSDATGDIYYRSVGTVLTRLGVGSTGDVLTVAAGLPSWAAPAASSTIVVANEATDTTCFPVFVTAATGSLGPKSNTGLTFNSNTASLGATLITATTSVTTASVLASSNDSGALGASGTAWADLFLASGGVINWVAGDYTLTHSSGVLTANKDLRITTVGTDATSVPTLGSTSTLTAKTLTSPTIQTTPVLAAGTNVIFTVPSSDDTATGDITNAFNSGYTSSAIGDLVYLDSSSTWQKADADASAATYSGLLGIALEVKASGNALKVLLRGFAYCSTAFPTFTVGSPVYMSATAGAVTQTAPTTTDSATRLLGYAVHADKMWFSPSNDWITHT